MLRSVVGTFCARASPCFVRTVSISSSSPIIRLVRIVPALTMASQTDAPSLHTRSHESTTTTTTHSTSGSSIPGMKKTLDLSQVAAQELANKDILTIIRSEHTLVDKLAEKFQSSSSKTEKLSIAYNIIKLLSLHAAKEEMALYPFLRTKFPNGDQLVDHALKEHQQVKQDLYDLDQQMNTEMTSTTDAKLLKCIKDVQHHVQEEEDTILTKLNQYLSPAEMTKVRDDFVSALSTAPSRPHPDAPNTPPQNKVLNAATMPADAARDAARFASTAPSKSDYNSLNTMAS